MSDNIMEDGSIVPSNLNSGTVQKSSNNTMMVVGMVINMIYPDEPKSLTKQVIEYDVLVTDMDRDRGMNLSIYRNCRLSDRFGTPNNSEVFTLTPGKRNSNGNYEKGSIVLIECIAGNCDFGMATIIGGINTSSINQYTKEDGQFYDFFFNGVRQKINKDGEFLIEFNSFIDVDGNKANEKAAGTKLLIDKEGRIKISDNEEQFWELDRVARKSTWSNGAESVVIDKANKKIELISSGTMSSTSKDDMSLKADKNIKAEAKANVEIKAGANIKIEAKSGMNQTSGGNWDVKATGNITVTSGGAAIIKGGAIAQIMGATTLIGAGSVPVAAVGISMCIGTGNLSVPVISTVITGSATVLVGT